MSIKDYTDGLPYGSLGETFLNTFEVALLQPEHLGKPSDLDSFLSRHGLDAKPSTIAHVVAAREFREDLRDLFSDALPKEARLVHLNELLAGAALTAQVRNLGHGKHEFFPVCRDTANPVERLRNACLINVSAAVVRFGIERFRTCEASPCQDAFIDRTKKGARRYCSSRCGSRWHVRQHRQRIAIQGDLVTDTQS